MLIRVHVKGLHLDGEAYFKFFMSLHLRLHQLLWGMDYQNIQTEISISNFIHLEKKNA